jgi:hypothetical protein
MVFPVAASRLLLVPCETAVAGGQQLPRRRLIPDEAGNVWIETLANRVCPFGSATVPKGRQPLLIGDAGGVPR